MKKRNFKQGRVCKKKKEKKVKYEEFSKVLRECEPETQGSYSLGLYG